MLPFLWKQRPCGAPCQAIAVGAQTRYSCNPAKEPNIANGPAIGTVIAIWRYPVKSMQGEELSTSPVDERGLLGDRGYALVHAEDGKVASAKIHGNGRIFSNFELATWKHLFPTGRCRQSALRCPMEAFTPAALRVLTRHYQQRWGGLFPCAPPFQKHPCWRNIGRTSTAWHIAKP